MSIVTSKGIRIPDVLIFVGLVVIGGVGYFGDTIHRVFAFGGDVLVAAGYVWQRFFVNPDVTSQK